MVASSEQQKILDKISWNQKSMVPEYSYAGIAVYLEKFPVTDGHLIFVPLDPKNINMAFNRALRIGQEMVDKKHWDGFNIGMNSGEAAGQTNEWPHMHLIPRRKGDCLNPFGGIRGVIPNCRDWRLSKNNKKTKKV